MSLRKILILSLILLIFIVPFVQLSIGFYYVDYIELCPLQPDIALIMAMGGVFLAIFFAAAIGFIYSITPPKFKTNKKLTAAQLSAKGSNRSIQLLIGAIMCIFGTCAFIFIILLNTRIYGNLKKFQSKSPKESTYCLYTIFSSAFGLMIATYVAFALLFVVAGILLFGIGL
ncbi:hypothetical protein I4U23_013551 [Adineta vaga]|nr:hypothetical protein I4U23_013551 [Adineta vaga]